MKKLALVLALTAVTSFVATAASSVHWTQINGERAEVMSRDGKVLVNLTTNASASKLAIKFHEADSRCEAQSFEPVMVSMREVNGHLIYMIKKCTAPNVATWVARDVEDQELILELFKTKPVVSFDNSRISTSAFNDVETFIAKATKQHKVPVTTTVVTKEWVTAVNAPQVEIIDLIVADTADFDKPVNVTFKAVDYKGKVLSERTITASVNIPIETLNGNVASCGKDIFKNRGSKRSEYNIISLKSDQYYLDKNMPGFESCIQDLGYKIS